MKELKLINKGTHKVIHEEITKVKGIKAIMHETHLSPSNTVAKCC